MTGLVNTLPEFLFRSSKWLRGVKTSANFRTHGRIRMNICVRCGMHLSQFSDHPCEIIHTKNYPDPNGRFGWLRRKIWSRCFVFSCKRMAYVRNRSEHGGDYINWFGIAQTFDRLYWKSAGGRK